MDLLREILEHEVYPALGCTEPVSCAYAAALAAAHLGEDVQELAIEVDAGTFKNGAAVVVPRTGGQKGNLIAAALGAVISRPDCKLEILQNVQAVDIIELIELALVVVRIERVGVGNLGHDDVPDDAGVQKR